MAFVGMYRRPFHIVQPVEKYVTFKQINHIDPFLDQRHKVLLKQVAENNIVLILDDVIDDGISGSDLIVLDSCVYRRNTFILRDFGLVENRILTLKQMLMLHVK